MAASGESCCRTCVPDRRRFLSLCRQRSRADFAGRMPGVFGGLRRSFEPRPPFHRPGPAPLCLSSPPGRVRARLPPASSGDLQAMPWADDPGGR